MKSIILHLTIYAIFANIYMFIIQIMTKNFPIYKWEGLDLIVGVLTSAVLFYHLRKTANYLINKLSDNDKRNT